MRLKRRPHNKRSRGSVSSFANDKIQYKGKSTGKCIVPFTRDREELKVFNIALTSIFNSVSSSNSIYNCSAAISQGTDFNVRIGRAIRIRAIRISGSLIGGQSNVALDEQRNSFRVVVGLVNVGATFTFSVTDMFDPRTRSGLKKIYYDKTMLMLSPGRDSVGYMPSGRQIELRIPVNHEQLYTGSSGSTQTDDSLIVSMVSDSSTTPNPGFVNGQLIIEFEDF